MRMCQRLVARSKYVASWSVLPSPLKSPGAVETPRAAGGIGPDVGATQGFAGTAGVGGGVTTMGAAVSTGDGGRDVGGAGGAVVGVAGAVAGVAGPPPLPQAVARARTAGRSRAEMRRFMLHLLGGMTAGTGVLYTCESRARRRRVRRIVTLDARLLAAIMRVGSVARPKDWHRPLEANVVRVR
jgi:hypothetical protein